MPPFPDITIPPETDHKNLLDKLQRFFVSAMPWWKKLAGASSSSAVDHGLLAGLTDDDHVAYLTTARHTAIAGDHVTNGDTHDHSGGDGAQINHAGLSNLAVGDPHTQYALEGSQAIYTPASVTVNAGTPAGGVNVSQTQTPFDGNEYQVTEAAATPGFDIEIAFSGVSSFDMIVARICYDGAATHWVGLEVYDYNGTAWVPVGLVLHSSTYFQYYTFKIPPSANYMSAGAAKIRLNHYSAGNPAHDVHIDYAALVNNIR